MMQVEEMGELEQKVGKNEMRKAFVILFSAVKYSFLQLLQAIGSTIDHDFYG